jgi:predicted O-linked N-acetylglucosamine transferase (SPINDLY family)
LIDALEQYRSALRVDPARADVQNDLATALAMQGRLDEAISAFQQVLQLDPNNAGAHNNLGNALRIQGRLEEALPHFREALRLNPNFAEAHHNLGIALLHLRRPDDAVASFQQALRLKPTYMAALDSLQQALKQCPNHAEGHNNLGNILFKLGRLDEARACYEQAVCARPTLAEAHGNLANVLCMQGFVDQAVAAYQQALLLKPDYADAHSNLGNARRDQGRLDDAIAGYQQARRLKPDEQVYHANLLGTLIYHPHYDSRAIYEEHCRWQRDHALALAPAQPSFANDPSPDRRLRIGYVSPDFSGHVVGRNIWPLLRNHDHGQFDITLYANLARGDPMTEQFQKCADHWSPIAGLPDQRVADRIRQDGIDILVDLAVHTLGNRLLVFARKPAPVQVTFAGYPGTTGLSTIDYRLTDPYLDPPGLSDAWYAELSYRLPHSFWCYDPQSEEPEVAPLPALSKGFITFGCLNNFCKVNDEVLQLWARVLGAVPTSRLLLLSKEGSHRQRTLDFLARQGVPAERVEFQSGKPRREYLALYHNVDIGLDTFPYNGHTTSLDSFWMGVPVITLVGITVVGRAGLSQLTNLGLEELAARAPEDFVRIAVDLAGDRAKLQTLHSGLRERMRRSPLMDALGFARGIEQAYRTMWRQWCDRGRSRTPSTAR